MHTLLLLPQFLSFFIVFIKVFQIYHNRQALLYSTWYKYCIETIHHLNAPVIHRNNVSLLSLSLLMFVVFYNKFPETEKLRHIKL